MPTKQKSNVDVWLQRETLHVRRALESASRHFDMDDNLTVNTLEAVYGRERSFGTQMGTRGSSKAAGHFQFIPDTAIRYGLSVSEGRYVYGDFNRDGLKDAAVVIAQSEGGSGHFLELAFLINDGGQLVHRISHYLGDRVIVNSLKKRSGKVVIDMFVHREWDSRAGPTKRVRNVYDYLNPNPDLIPYAHAWTPPQ